MRLKAATLSKTTKARRGMLKSQATGKVNEMQREQIRLWWDGEGDFLYVAFADGDGDMVRTRDGKAMVKVDDDGNVLGFQLLGVSKRGKGRKPLSVTLTPETDSDAGEFAP